MGERRISINSPSWQLLHSTQERRGSGAPSGSFSSIGANQILLVQIEQRADLYQRVLCVVSRLGATATSLPGIIFFIVRAPSFPLTTIGERSFDPLVCSVVYLTYLLYHTSQGKALLNAREAGLFTSRPEVLKPRQKGSVPVRVMVTNCHETRTDPR